VWKVVLILRKYRPELHVTIVDAAPTGLVICTNLNPESTILTESYHDIVEEFRDLSLVDYGVAQYLSEANLMRTDAFRHFSDFTSRFWL
jgi:hypothetical protein